MLKKIIASLAVASALFVSFASSSARANPAPAESAKTLGCYSIGTPCDHNGTCCSSLCVHHRCVAN